MDRFEKWILIRIRLVGFCFLLVFALIAGRAFYLQVLSQPDWQRRAERQHQKLITLTPQRGTIFDRNHEELALSTEVDSIYAEPRKVSNPAGQARALAKVLGLSSRELKAKLSSKKNFVWLKRQAPPSESDQVRKLQLAGIHFTREHRRFYPNSEIGAQVVGFTGVDPKGLEGIELQYDSLILGQGGIMEIERDALGRGMGAGDHLVQEGRRGSDLVLTLDRNIQYIAEKELAAGVKKTNSSAGTALVIDPSTGDILAMASQPDYNPNSFKHYRPNHWRNRALCDTYEPGSTLKVFVMAAALNEGVVHSGQKIDCEKGSFWVGGRVIHDHHPYEKLTVEEIVKFSSNIGSAKIGKALERERLYNYLRDFGFGAPTGIDLPGEVGGLLRSPSRWFELDLAAISFGQGLTVTSLQLARATAAIANGGNLMSSDLVRKVIDNQGQVVEERRPRTVRRVVSESVARKVARMMAMTTEKGGTGTLAAVPGFKVAGKTGTAQKVDPVTGGYSADKRVASFVGFVPVEDPRLVVLVVLDEPQGKTYGGLVAAPVFSRIASQALRYLKVAPTEDSFQSPLPPIVEMAALEEPEPEPAEGDAAGMRMPNFSGMSYRQVLETMARTGINVRLDGTGRVVRQSPPAGRAVKFDKQAWVKMAPPS